MKNTIVLACLIGASLAARRKQAIANNVPNDIQKVEFLKYSAINNKQYKSTREFKRKMKNWTAVDNYIRERNMMQTSFTLAHNWLSDLSRNEKRKMFPVVKDLPKTSVKQVGYCGAGCQECADSTTCSLCFDGFALNNGVCECSTNQINYYETACLTCTSGQYWSDFLKRCVNCSAGCNTCSDMLTCTSCDTPLTLTNGVCKCGGYIGADGSCFVCSDSNMYFDGNACQTCGDHCEFCSTPSGNCSQCETGFEVKDDGSCGCPLGYYE